MLAMELPFVNRKQELAELDSFARRGGLLVVFGRRRVGKTRLLTHWLTRRSGLYSQAIEASTGQQLQQVVDDVSTSWAPRLTPRSWLEFFELVESQPKRLVLCLDEFPYLTVGDPSLPSIIQRFLDHGKKGTALVLSGSSTRMMNDLFLNRGAPLYGRAQKLLHVEPMSYAAFCAACKLNPIRPATFTLFSLVGGVPKYWELVERGQTPTELAEALFFGISPFLEFEPARLLKDENVAGHTALAILEAVGRGSEKPSEIAARLGVPQTGLSRLLQVLLDAHLLERQVPFGESIRTTKRSLYRLSDPTLRFWFRVYSPHRSRWSTYSAAEKEKLLDDHASTIFEDQLRASWPGSQRFWEAAVELDLIREEQDELVVGEIKWTSLSKAERKSKLAALEARFRRSQLAAKHPKVRFEVHDVRSLSVIAGTP
jgi:AAA+ ATPase superfamily predicted ATPase